MIARWRLYKAFMMRKEELRRESFMLNIFIFQLLLRGCLLPAWPDASILSHKSEDA